MEGFMNTSRYAKVDESLIGFTEDQYDSLRRLIAELVERYPALKMDRQHIVGHDEYAPERKHDPGELFDWDELGFPDEDQ